jgi:hypothetical protein
MGIPIAAGVSEAGVLLLAVVILLEGGMIQNRLRIPLGRALYASLVANLATTAIGVALGALSIVTAGGDLLLLPVLFAATVAVEAWILGRMLHLERRPALGLSLKVNAASYVVVVLVAIELLAHRHPERRLRPEPVRQAPTSDAAP